MLSIEAGTSKAGVAMRVAVITTDGTLAVVSCACDVAASTHRTSAAAVAVGWRHAATGHGAAAQIVVQGFVIAQAPQIQSALLTGNALSIVIISSSVA